MFPIVVVIFVRKCLNFTGIFFFCPSTALSGGRVTAADLRGGAALVLAGLAADGLTEVADVFHIDRGYEGFEAKLRSLGADIKRESDYKQHEEMISA